jgi:hypothetical protein
MVGAGIIGVETSGSATVIMAVHRKYDNKTYNHNMKFMQQIKNITGKFSEISSKIK